MFDLLGSGHRLCDRVTRREMLRVGALAPLGLQLPALLAAGANNSAHAATGARSFGKAKRCLVLYMWGGPAHQDTFDMKPDAPDGIRGEFKPIGTSVPGIDFCEYLPELSKRADRLALVRSVTHSDNRHSTAAHWMLTGRKHRLSAENFGASADDFPHIGSVLSKVAPVGTTLPTFVSMPEKIATTAGAITPGQNGGILGKRYDPFTIDQHPDEPDFQVPSLRLPDSIDPLRVQARRDLLGVVDAARRTLDQSRQVSAMNDYYHQALDLITSPDARQAFALDDEDPRTRDRYGRHTFGQCALLARRLLEAGVKLVTVYWHRDKPGVDTTWDTHGKNFSQLKERLLPQVDAPLSVLLDELAERGLLEDTLVVWTSEFGRTPKINGNAGRDHWGPCNTIWFAGGGTSGGTVHGSSDKQAGEPASDPVHPEDVSATIYHLLGIDTHTTIHDQQGRPLVISEGKPIQSILT